MGIFGSMEGFLAGFSQGGGRYVLLIGTWFVAHFIGVAVSGDFPSMDEGAGLLFTALVVFFGHGFGLLVLPAIIVLVFGVLFLDWDPVPCCAALFLAVFWQTLIVFEFETPWAYHSSRPLKDWIGFGLQLTGSLLFSLPAVWLVIRGLRRRFAAAA